MRWILKKLGAQCRENERSAYGTIGNSCRYEVSWTRTRFLGAELQLMDKWDFDLKIFVGLWFGALWLTFPIGAVFSPKQRSRFQAKHGNDARVVGWLYHDATIWLSTWKKMNETSSSDPWWWRVTIAMPWESRWLSTEILSHDLKRVLFCETWRDRRPGLDRWDERCAAIANGSKQYRYVYITRRGEKQEATATVHVDRMKWGYKWLPLPLRARTSIGVEFDREIGERCGTWKGGTVGCGYEMKRGETPETTLLRMQLERKFN
jgi:hypothetical protein